MSGLTQRPATTIFEIGGATTTVIDEGMPAVTEEGFSVLGTVAVVIGIVSSSFAAMSMLYLLSA